jgi:immune inhibitor A
MKNSSIILIIVGVLLVLCCCIVVVIGIGVLGVYQFRTIVPTIAAYTTIFPNNDVTPTPFEITRQPVDDNNSATLNTLEQTIIPDRDLAALACSLKDICNIPPTEPPPSSPLVAGAKTQLWLLSTDSNTFSRINVTLQYVTPHAYFWVEDGVSFVQADAKDLIDTFENKIYPTDREFFGSEWTPGVDDDPHLYIIYARNLGGNVAGFYNTGDEYPPEISQYSNHRI